MVPAGRLHHDDAAVMPPGHDDGSHAVASPESPPEPPRRHPGQPAAHEREGTIEREGLPIVHKDTAKAGDPELLQTV
jgi:hypothetical protein